jgi:hypothetical protein
MSGIDYLTIARWVARKDGGVLIGRVYGHLTDIHAQKQAQRLQFKVLRHKGGGSGVGGWMEANQEGGRQNRA